MGFIWKKVLPTSQLSSEPQYDCWHACVCVCCVVLKYLVVQRHFTTTTHGIHSFIIHVQNEHYYTIETRLGKNLKAIIQ